MSASTIHVAFDTALETFASANSLKVGWENVAFDPPRGSIFLTVRMSAYTERPIGSGANARAEASGIYQINVHAPPGFGTKPALDMVALIEAAFPRGLNLSTTDSKSVTVRQVTPQPMMVEQQWVTVPVLVDWFSTY